MGIKSFIRNVLNIPNFFYNYSLLKYRHVQFGSNLNIRGRIFCVANKVGAIKIGDNVTINSCRASNPIGGDIKTIIFAKDEGEIYIGNNVGISNVTICAHNSITIGNNVMIGGSVKIYDTDFHWLDIEKRLTSPGGKTKPIIIKDGAFIGAHTIILKGVTIGYNSIVGAGSIVTKNVPDGEIWAGNPARFISIVTRA